MESRNIKRAVVRTDKTKFIKEGIVYQYDQNDKLMYTFLYDEEYVLYIAEHYNIYGEISRIITYYPDGMPKSVIRYSNGKRHGRFTSYHSNGVINHLINYNNDAEEFKMFFRGNCELYKTEGER